MARRSKAKKGVHSSTITIEGLAPDDDPLWGVASSSVKHEFFNFCKGLAHTYFKEQLRLGIDRYGEKLAPIAPSTRAKGRWRSYTGKGTSHNPPLVPAMDESRTIKWLRSNVNHIRQVVTLWWSHGWGEIITYHGDGLVPHAPERDIRGLAPVYDRRLRDQAQGYWLRTRPRVRREAERRGTSVPRKAPERPARTPPAAARGPARPTAPTRPARPKVTVKKGARFDIENAILSTGATTAEIKAAMERGTFSGFTRIVR